MSFKLIMESKMFVRVPEEFDIILQRVIEKNWLITCFEADGDAIYNPADYCYNKVFAGINYKLVLDRNIFQYIIKSARVDRPHEEYKDAIALLVFCQIAEIEIEPHLAIYEKINYSDKNADEAIEELQDFYNIDNSQTEGLIKYVLGETNKVDVTFSKVFDKYALKKQLMRYKRLEEWDSLYLLIMRLVSIHGKDADNKFKFHSFIEWMTTNFKLSNIVIVYSIILLFSPLPRMIKYRSSESREKKQQALRNMTWDVYFMNRFLRLWQRKISGEEIIFASNDNVIRNILSLAIEVNQNASWEPLKNYISEKDYMVMENAFKSIDTIKNRVYGTSRWTTKHRQNLIEELENELL